MSTRLGLFYVQRFRNQVHCTFKFIFLCRCFLKVFARSYTISSVSIKKKKIANTQMVSSIPIKKK